MFIHLLQRNWYPCIRSVYRQVDIIVYHRLRIIPEMEILLWILSAETHLSPILKLSAAAFVIKLSHHPCRRIIVQPTLINRWRHAGFHDVGRHNARGVTSRTGAWSGGYVGKLMLAANIIWKTYRLFVYSNMTVGCGAGEARKCGQLGLVQQPLVTCTLCWGPTFLSFLLLHMSSH